MSQAANPAEEERDASTNINDSESAPNSQETQVSNSSRTSGVSQLQSDSSSLSNASYDTSSTSPVSLKATLAHPVATTLQTPTSHIERPETPEIRNVLKDSASEGASSVSTSPLSVGSQTLKQGSKRTASGAVKPPSVDITGAVDHGRHTSESVDAGRARSSSRAAEVGTPFHILLREANSTSDLPNSKQIWSCVISLAAELPHYQRQIVRLSLLHANDVFRSLPN